MDHDGSGAEGAANSGLKHIAVEVAGLTGPAEGVVAIERIDPLGVMERGQGMVAEREPQERPAALFKIEAVEKGSPESVAGAFLYAILDALLLDERAAEVGVGLVVREV